MKTEFTCSRCGVACATDRDLAGRRVRCLSCGFVQRIPDASVTPSVAAEQLPACCQPPRPLSRPVRGRADLCAAGIVATSASIAIRMARARAPLGF